MGQDADEDLRARSRHDHRRVLADPVGFGGGGFEIGLGASGEGSCANRKAGKPGSG